MRRTRVGCSPGARRTVRMVAAVAGLFAVVAGRGAVAQEDVVRYGVYANEPKVFAEAPGQAAGIFPDLLRAIAAREGWRLEPVVCAWRDCLDALAAGRIDLMPDVAYTAERARRFDFHAEPALHSWSDVYTLPERPVDSTLDLAGRRIAVMGGSVQERFLHRLLEDFGVQAEWVRVADFHAGFAAVAGGDADLVVTNHQFGARHAPTYGLIRTPVSFQPAPLYFAATAGVQEDRLAAIDRYLASWKQDPGSLYYEILDRWTGGAPRPALPGYLPELAGTALAALVLFMGISTWLRRQVVRKTRELQQSRDQLDTILDSVEAYIYIKDASYRYVYVNSRTGALFGKRPQDLIGQTDADLFDAATAEQLRVNDRQVIEEGRRFAAEESKAVPGGGGSYVFLTVKLPLRDERGQVYALCGISTDITERKRTEQELERHRNHLQQLVDERTGELAEAKEAAERATDLKSRFLANMSHEIRTPMNAVMGLASLMRQTELDGRQREYMRKLEGASRHLLRIIDDILDVSRMEAGKLELSREVFEPARLFEEVTSLVTPELERKNLSLDVVLAPDLPDRLVGDPLRLAQVLINFLNNAVKFTERGGVSLRAEALPPVDGDLVVRFAVGDTGIGIDVQDRRRLFESFEQADVSTTRRHGGTGLGLAIAKRLAELMGGEVGVDSVPGEGSTFWFTATLGVADPADRPAVSILEAQPGRGAPVAQDLAGARVLLAEDNELNQEVAVEMLHGLGLKVDVVPDGAAAVKRLGEASYDVVLMDMQMPVLDGLAATRAIRARRELRDLPVIAMTANVMAGDRERCLEAGMNDHLAKPIELGVLSRKLAAWVKPRASGTEQAPAGTMDPPQPAAGDLLADVAGLDVADGLRRAMGRDSLYLRLLQRFAAVHADAASRIAQARQQGDWESAGRIAHTLKGVAGQIAAPGIVASAARLELALHERAGDEAFDRLLGELEAPLARLVGAIEQHLPQPE